eukprot:918916-Rhodomonas_salina.2
MLYPAPSADRHPDISLRKRQHGMPVAPAPTRPPSGCCQIHTATLAGSALACLTLDAEQGCEASDLGERCSVVDAVAHHRDPRAGLLQRLDCLFAPHFKTQHRASCSSIMRSKE